MTTLGRVTLATKPTTPLAVFSLKISLLKMLPPMRSTLPLQLPAVLPMAARTLVVTLMLLMVSIFSRS